jgi:hypothetical protein
MKEKYSSFICEHTAEYILIPQLTNILKRRFELVVPIFPWLTREGSTLSKTIHRQDQFKIVGFYPRRPKINLADNKILVKINHEFLEGAEEASRINIPMLAGCPLAKNFWELNEHTKCFWIKLTDKKKPFYEIEYNDRVPAEFKFLEKTEVLDSDEDILNFVITDSKDHNFESLIQAIQIIRAHGSIVYFMGLASYKPIYFLLKDKI